MDSFVNLKRCQWKELGKYVNIYNIILLKVLEIIKVI